LHAELNPGCFEPDHCTSVSKLLYIRADGDNDTVHYLFDFTQKPSLVIVTTANNANILVKYNETQSNVTIKFTKAPFYTFASVFNKVSKEVFILIKIHYYGNQCAYSLIQF
jgi:hypothetical protein